MHLYLLYLLPFNKSKIGELAIMIWKNMQKKALTQRIP